MSEVVHQSLAVTLQEIESHIAKQCQLPDPNAGFAEYVLRTCRPARTASQALSNWPSDDQFRHAPSLACFGFLVACNAPLAMDLHDEWKRQLGAILKKAAFPVDRQSFAFRPIEVLGIALGGKNLLAGDDPALEGLRVVVQRCMTEGNDDPCSKLLYAVAGLELGVGPEILQIEPEPNWSLEYAANLKWAASRTPVGRLCATEAVDAAEERILIDCSVGRFRLGSLAEASVLYDSLSNSILRRISSRLSETANCPATREDALSAVVLICRRFPLFARQLLVRRKSVAKNTKRQISRPTITMRDEYDVQDALHALLRLYFDTVEPEVWTPSYAGNQSRIDFVLPEHKIVIEAKFFGDKKTNRAIAQELIVDERYYQESPHCETLVALVYDPDLRCTNPQAFERDITEKSQIHVIAIVCPRGH
jgi:REase_DpnII-MboI